MGKLAEMRIKIGKMKVEKKSKNIYWVNAIEKHFSVRDHPIPSDMPSHFQPHLLKKIQKIIIPPPLGSRFRKSVFEKSLFFWWRLFKKCAALTDDWWLMMTMTMTAFQTKLTNKSTNLAPKSHRQQAANFLTKIDAPNYQWWEQSAPPSTLDFLGEVG